MDPLPRTPLVDVGQAVKTRLVNEPRAWMRENWRWLTIGTGLVVGVYIGIYGTFWIVARQFWPQSAPVQIEAFAFRTSKLVPGETAGVHVEFQKDRNCQPSARLVFVNPEGEERQFMFPEWPSRGTGDHDVNMLIDVPPTLGSGTFDVLARVVYSCNDGHYLAESKPVSVEIAAPLSDRR